MAIASCLVDTNILLRMTRRSDPQHQVVDAALARLAGQSTTLHYTHQNVAELWNAMTPPLTRNGFALTVAEADREVRAIEAGMIFLPDNEAVYSRVAENCRAARRIGRSGTRCALGRCYVRTSREPHTHVERVRLQPFQRPHRCAPE